MQKYFFIVCFWLGYQALLTGQSYGCTDPQAVNFDSAAQYNDGSCQYPLTSYLPDLLTNLATEVNETSGLMYFGSNWWTHNDSGGLPVLYKFDDQNGDILKRVFVSNATNVDWEDMARDEHFAYVGDFGNNNGNRRDLTIYRVPLDSLVNDTLLVDLITFEYPDQQDFSIRPNSNDYDMEVLIAMGDSLYLFSKNWIDLKTRVYRLPKIPGNYVATLLDSFDVQGLITGGSFVEKDSMVALVGYTPLLTPFVWLLWDFKGSRFFGGNKRRIELGIFFHQVEAIEWHPTQGCFYISNERFSNIITTPARLYKLEIDQWISNPTTALEYDERPIVSFSIYPNPAGDTIYFQEDPIPLNVIANLLLFDTNGKVYVSQRIVDGELSNGIDISKLPTGVYFVHLSGNAGIWRARFVKH